MILFLPDSVFLSVDPTSLQLNSLPSQCHRIVDAVTNTIGINEGFATSGRLDYLDFTENWRYQLECNLVYENWMINIDETFYMRHFT